MKSTPIKFHPAVLTLLILSLLAGCATGQRFTPPATVPKDKAVVYVYRERRFVGSAGSPDIFINGEQVVKLKSGGYYIYYADPGEVVFSNQLAFGAFGALWAVVDRVAEAKKHAVLQFRVQGGREYYAEWELGFKMTLRNGAEAKGVIANCRLLEGAKR